MLNVIDIENILVIKPEGRVDAFTVGNLESWLEDASARTLVDLSGVTFMDTRAITVLVQGLKRCREAGGDLKLCSPTKAVRVILELMRLDKAFELFDTEQEALRAFS